MGVQAGDMFNTDRLGIGAEANGAKRQELEAQKYQAGWRIQVSTPKAAKKTGARSPEVTSRLENARISSLVAATFEYVAATPDLKRLHDACLPYLFPSPIDEWEREETHFGIPDGLAVNLEHGAGKFGLARGCEGWHSQP